MTTRSRQSCDRREAWPLARLRAGLAGKRASRRFSKSTASPRHALQRVGLGRSIELQQIIVAQGAVRSIFARRDSRRKSNAPGSAEIARRLRFHKRLDTIARAKIRGKRPCFMRCRHRDLTAGRRSRGIGCRPFPCSRYRVATAPGKGHGVFAKPPRQRSGRLVSRRPAAMRRVTWLEGIAARSTSQLPLTPIASPRQRERSAHAPSAMTAPPDKKCGGRPAPPLAAATH